MLFFILMLTSCLNQPVDGAKVRAAAFREPESAVTIMGSGGMNWTDIDIWVSWKGPATLKSSKGFAPCADLASVVNEFVKRDPARSKLLADTPALTCQQKGGG